MRTFLHLGSGPKPRMIDDIHVVHVDIAESAPHVELVCDLNHGIPLPANCVDGVIAANVIEHLDDVIGIMNEIHRVLVPHGQLWVQVPLYGTPNHITDPTHKHGFAMESFDFFDDATPLGGYAGKLYTPRRWTIVRKQEITQDLLLEMQALKPGETARPFPFSQGGV